MAIKAVKYSFGSDKRRVAGTVDFDKLCELVESAFEVKVGGDYLIQYVDEENESITINSQKDLDEAYQVVEEDGRSSLQVRVVDLKFNGIDQGEWQYEQDEMDEHQSHPDSIVESADEFEMVETASKFSSDDEIFQAGDVSTIENAEGELLQVGNDEEEEESVNDGEEEAVIEGNDEKEEEDVERVAEDENDEEEFEKSENDEEFDEAKKVVEGNDNDGENGEISEEDVKESSTEEGDEVVEEPVSQAKEEVEVPQETQEEEEEVEVPEENENNSDDERVVEEIEKQSQNDEGIADVVDEEDLVDSIIEEVSDELNKEENSAHVQEEKVKEERLTETEELPPELIQALIDLEEQRTSGNQDSNEQEKEQDSNEQEKEEAEKKNSDPPKPFHWNDNNDNPIQGVVNGILGLVSSAQATLEKEKGKNTPTGDMAKSIGKVLEFVQKVASAPDTDTTSSSNNEASSSSSSESEDAESESDSKSNSNSKTNPSLFANLNELLSNSQVVQKIQNALAEPEINELVVALAMLYSTKAEPTGQQFMAVILSRAGSLLQWLHRLVNSIPELLMATPQLAAYILSLLHRSFGQPKSSCNSQPPRSFPHHPFRGPRRWCGGKPSWCSKPSPVNDDSPKPTHFGVYCDGCSQNRVDKTNSVKGGTYETGTQYIRGVRYKSAVEEDFDLCSTCESTGKYTAQAPFLKIDTPSKAPRSIICVVSEQDEKCEFPRHGRRPFRFRGCRRGRRNWRDRVNQHVNQHEFNGPNQHSFMEKVVEHPRDLEKGLVESFAQMAMANNNGHSNEKAAPVAQKDESDLKCPQNHKLKEHLTRDERYFCDICNKRIPSGDKAYGCRVCDFDACTPCMQKKQQSTHAAAPEALPVEPTAPVVKTQRTSRPQARFLGVLRLPDGSVVRPGQSMCKVWRIQNSGDSQWPEGSRMVCVGGERMNGPISGVALPAAQPGKTVDVSLPLRAPTQPGRYVAYWRCVTGTNARFGHRFWVDINVQGQTPEVLASSVMQPLRSALDAWNSPATSVQAVSDTNSQPPKTSTTAAAPSNTQQQDNSQESSSSTNTTQSTTPSIPELHRRFSDELTQMANMGFCDLDKNAELLNKHNGRVDLAISDIMDSAYLDVVDRGL